MQPRNLLLTTLTATLAIGITTLFNHNWQSVNALVMPSPSTKITPQVALKQASVKGNFIKADHPTKGIAQVITKDGKQYLKFDRSFKSDSGPDLFVLLHRQGSPKSYRETDYVNLGKLKKTSGEQLYQIPAGTNVAEFKSAVVWCRLFSSTFGFAPLK